MSQDEIIKSIDKNPEKWSTKKYDFMEVMKYLKNRL